MVTGFGCRNNVTTFCLLDGLTMTTSAWLPFGPFRILKTYWFVLRSQFLNIMLIWQFWLSCCRLSRISCLRTFGARIRSGCFSASWSDQRVLADSLLLVMRWFGQTDYRFGSAFVYFPSRGTKIFCSIYTVKTKQNRNRIGFKFTKYARSGYWILWLHWTYQAKKWGWSALIYDFFFKIKFFSRGWFNKNSIANKFWTG